MPKQFYTEKDIEDLVHSGRRSLQVTDEVVLTELAYEKAQRLGLQLISEDAANRPAAPARPHLSDGSVADRSRPMAAPAVQVSSPPEAPRPAILPIEQRIRSAVVAKLGDQVDAGLLDTIIHRVVKGLGMK